MRVAAAMSEYSATTTAIAVPKPATPAVAAGTVRHIPSLDGLRAMSFLIVMVAHGGLANAVPGGFGVTVFSF